MLYVPQEDSYLLKDCIKEYVHSSSKVLDMGSGTGIQAEEALNYSTDVLAIDVNPEAVDFVKKKGIQARVSDLFSNVKEKFDVILFNPPYLPKDEAEPEDSALATTGGEKGYETIERFLKEAKNHLEENGKILLLFSSLTGDIDSILEREGYVFKQIRNQKFFFEELFVYEVFVKKP